MKLFLLLDIHFQEIIAEGENETYFAKPCVVVGKLNIKEADFFEKKEVCSIKIKVRFIGIF